jgi:class 3 adenylate cyclase
MMKPLPDRAHPPAADPPRATPQSAAPLSDVKTFLFTDIVGSTDLWECAPERMQVALARHDAIVRAAVLQNGGAIVKMTGDGTHAAFDDAVDAVRSTVELQRHLDDPEATNGLRLSVRCGLHAGAAEPRDDDYFGVAVNRAARIMGAAHGGQILLSHAVAVRVGERLPPDVTLRDLGWARLRGLPCAQRLYQVVHPQLQTHFPPLHALAEVAWAPYGALFIAA